MAEETVKRNFLLKNDPPLQLSEVVELLTELSTGPNGSKIIRSVFENPAENLTDKSEYFTVTYEPEKYNELGKISNVDLRNLLNQIKGWLSAYGRKRENNVADLLPTGKDSSTKLYRVLYELGEYSQAATEGIQKVVIGELLILAQNFLSRPVPQDEPETGSFADIVNVKYNLLNDNGGNVTANWPRVKKFAEILFKLEIGSQAVEATAEFGRLGEKYRYGHALNVLNEYYDRAKLLLTTNASYQRLEKTKAQAAVNFTSASQPFFNQDFTTILLSSDDQLAGKLTTDSAEIERFIQIFDDLYEALKKVGAETETSAGEGTDAEGGGADEPLKKDDFLKSLTFDDFLQIFENRLIALSYEENYLPRIDDAIELIPGAREKEIAGKLPQIEIKKALFSVIFEDIYKKINPRSVLFTFLGTEAFKAYYIDGTVDYNEVVEKGLEDFCQNLVTTTLGISETIAIDRLISAIGGILGEELTEPTPTPTSPPDDELERKLGTYYVDKGKIKSDDWNRLEETDRTNARISFWKNLTIRERLEFLKDHNLEFYIQNYSQGISREFIELYLAKHGLSGKNVRPEDFAFILEEINREVYKNLEPQLIEIDPVTNWRNLPTTDLNRIERLIERRITARFGQVLEKMVTTTATTIAAKPTLTKEDLQQKEQKIELFAELVLRDIYSHDQFPEGIRLQGQDKNQSLLLNRAQFKDYLETHPEYLSKLDKEDGIRILLNWFIAERGAFFTPVIVERCRFQEREMVKKAILDKVGGNDIYAIQLKNNIDALFAQAIISGVDPKDYILGLSLEDLRKIYDLDSQFSEADCEEFRQLLLLYIEKSRKSLRLDKIIPETEEKLSEKEVDQFTREFLEIREFGKNLDQSRGAAIILRAVTEPEPSIEEIEALNEKAISHYELQLQIKKTIWQAYTAEQRQLIEIEAAKRKMVAENLPAYEWAQIAGEQAGEDDKKSGKAKGVTRKGLDAASRALTNKGLSAAGSTAAGTLVNTFAPGVGTALSAFINFLPISNRLKKMISLTFLGGTVSLIVTFPLTFAGMFFGSLILGPGLGTMIGGALGLGADLALKTVGSIWNGISSAASNFFSGVGNAAQGLLGNVFGTGAAATSGTTGAGGALTAGSGIFGGGGTTIAVGTAITTATLYIVTAQQSAYLTQPPDHGNFEEDTSSKYVTITKTPSNDKFTNAQDATVTYTIKVEVPPGTDELNPGFPITIDQASDNISLLGAAEDINPVKSNPAYDNLESAAAIATALPTGTVILPGESVELTYTIPDGPGEDIMISNAFKLSFWVTDGGVQRNESAQKTANVVIGDPVLGCFVFGEAGVNVKADGQTYTSQAWNEIDKERVQSGLNMVSGSTTFIGLVCAGGKPLTFYRLPNSQFGGYALSADSVGLFDLGVSSPNSAIYTTIHELGHIIHHRNSSLPRLFEEEALTKIEQSNTPAPHCLTYPYDSLPESPGFTCFDGEPFAEAIALYKIHEFYTFRTIEGERFGENDRRKYIFPDTQPAVYNWVRENIYGE